MRKLLLLIAFFLSIAATALAEEVKGKVTELNSNQITITDSSGNASTYPIKKGTHVHHMCSVNDEVTLTVKDGAAIDVKTAEQANQQDSADEQAETED